ncbi:MAG: acetolactate synthase 3 large subunit [Rhodobacteraceae bacterium]|nr:acetolactate synthase 3 large subunit [Paracoccaceae bacterium]
MTGAEIVIQALKDHDVSVVFGYPGGAILPIYDSLPKGASNLIHHVLVRHEQGALHAAEGYARATGKPGVVFVTSGPGVTNSVTGLADAKMDSVPVIVISGQVPTFMIGTDAFQEADSVGITRSCTKHNWLVQDTNEIAEVIHSAFHIATSGRPGPVLIDLPKDVQIALGKYEPPSKLHRQRYQPVMTPDTDNVETLAEWMETAERPIFYTGGGVINSGEAASARLRELVDATGFPITSTVMGLGSYPASGKHWLSMLGMHGSYEANLAMHGCDLMINVGARFDDRITGRIADFSPNSRKAHIDIDPASINKVIKVELGILGDAAISLEMLLEAWKRRGGRTNRPALRRWWQQIDEWRAKDCFRYRANAEEIKPQYALERLQALTKDLDRFVTTEVGQHQMWAAQFLHFEEPRRWQTSGGLGTMGYGFPSSLGIQLAHPGSLVINIAGEASWLMNMQEMSTAVQENAPVKQFILNNGYLGMVRQWQGLLHEGNYSQSWCSSLPDFVQLARAFGWKGITVSQPDKLDDAIRDMLSYEGPVILDCRVTKEENCFPMIPAGKPHNEMWFEPPASGDEPQSVTV